MMSKKIISIIIITLVFFLIPAAISAQGGFKSGYIINSSHQKINCLIANYGTENSSMKYVYKLSRKDSLRKVDISNTEEFGINDTKKFIRAKVILEVSDDRITQLSDTAKGLKWIEKYVFLQILVEGKFATLYYYFDEGIDRFFYSTMNTPIEPLIFKKYYLTVTPYHPTTIVLNNAYIRQLEDNLICPETMNPVKNLSYNKKKLIEYFKNYYLCNWTDYKVYGKVNKGKFKLKGGFIFDRSSFFINDGLLEYYDFPVNPGYTGGLEFEYSIPFNRYKWSLFAEVNYHYYKSTISEPALNSETSINYQFIEIPIGISYYFILNKNHKIFIRPGISPNFNINGSYISFYNPENKEEPTPEMNAFIGGGYGFKRLSLEFRYYSSKNITQNLYQRGSEFSQMSLLLKYTLFQSKNK